MDLIGHMQNKSNPTIKCGGLYFNYQKTPKILYNYF